MSNRNQHQEFLKIVYDWWHISGDFNSNFYFWNVLASPIHVAHVIIDHHCSKIECPSATSNQ